MATQANWKETSIIVAMPGIIYNYIIYTVSV